MLCFVFSILIILLDQLFKRWITLTMATQSTKEIIPGIISLTHVENTGAAFSILSDQRWLLAAVMSICVVVLVAILLRYNEGFWGTLGLAAVLGGAVGNLIDRVFRGYVVDMFEFQFMRFAIFNVADIFITLGGITFCIFFILTSIKASKTAKLAKQSKKKEDLPAPALAASSAATTAAATPAASPFAPATATAPVPATAPATARAALESDLDLSILAEIDSIVGAAVRDRKPDADAYASSKPTRGIDKSPKRPYPATEPTPVRPLPATESTPDTSSLLDELGLLDMDLSGKADEEYDIDQLLREYGFENDNN